MKANPTVGAKRPSPARLRKIAALAAHGVGGEQATALRLLQLYGRNTRQDVDANICNYQAPQRRQRIHVIDFIDENRGILFPLLAGIIANEGLQIFTRRHEPGALYCYGINVDFDTILPRYRAALAKAGPQAVDRAILPTISVTCWTGPSCEHISDRPLSPDALRAAGIPVTPGFVYHPGPEPYISDPAAWMRIYLHPDYVQDLIDILADGRRPELLWTIPAGDPLHIPGCYWLRRQACQGYDELGAQLRSKYEAAGGNPRTFMQATGLEAWNAGYRARPDDIDDRAHHIRPLHLLRPLGQPVIAPLALLAP